LPEHLRNVSLGYLLHDPARLPMSEHQLMNLFGQMNSIADALPRGMAFDGYCKLQFRALQKRHFAHLSRDE
jgi:hypothetical protein